MLRITQFYQYQYSQSYFPCRLGPSVKLSNFKTTYGRSSGVREIAAKAILIFLSFLSCSKRLFHSSKFFSIFSFDMNSLLSICSSKYLSKYSILSLVKLTMSPISSRRCRLSKYSWMSSGDGNSLLKDSSGRGQRGKVSGMRAAYKYIWSTMLMR